MKFYNNIKLDFGFHVDIRLTSGFDFRPEIDAVGSENNNIYQRFDRHCIEVYFNDRVQNLFTSGSTGNTTKKATKSD